MGNITEGDIALGLGSSIIGGAGSIISTAMANDANEKLWREMTRYNRPANQIQLLKEAGLNPALMYGKGISAGVASSPPSMSKFDIPNPLTDVASAQQVMNADAQHESILRSNEIAKQTARKIQVEADSAKRDLEIRKELSEQLDFPVQAGDDTKVIAGLKGALMANRAREAFGQNVNEFLRSPDYPHNIPSRTDTRK